MCKFSSSPMKTCLSKGFRGPQLFGTGKSESKKGMSGHKEKSWYKLKRETLLRISMFPILPICLTSLII